MSIRINAHIFSGRPNPHWSLATGELEELRARLENLVLVHQVEASSRPALGYSGLSVHLEGEVIYVREGLVRRGAVTYLDAGRNLEQWLVARAGKLYRCWGARKLSRVRFGRAEVAVTRRLLEALQECGPQCFNAPRHSLSPDRGTVSEARTRA